MHDYRHPPSNSHTLFPIYYLSQLKHLGSVHASALPHQINIGFDRSTAEARLQIRRRARVELNTVFAQ